MNIYTIPIESHFGGNYRLEYDGKYITLFGNDKKYGNQEMVLIAVVLEIRNATPEILEVTDKEIIISLGFENGI